jgi:branched-subunit amino acid transport protein
MTFWTIILGVAACTLLLRASFLLLAGPARIPTRAQGALRFVPVSILSAIVASAVFYREGTLNLSPVNPQFLAAAIAALVAWRTRNTLWTIGTGMATLWILNAVLGV